MDNSRGIRQAFLYENNVSQNWCGTIYVETSLVLIFFAARAIYENIYSMNEIFSIKGHCQANIPDPSSTGDTLP
ncbi:hypothetical protein [Aeromonas dhakensis]|uniref:hypothetical protein n=1 Tax=Aeromonas dhakensis TaxID=196024 RepID=UPI00227C8530|nr:hypothetical protein [Aeromonas dhakensis]WAF71092.1 hypothetical protein NRK99_13855 [Aeromonas dhakensis]